MCNCLNCGNKPKRSFYKYCSNKCQQTFQYKEYINKWKATQINGNDLIVTKNISRYIKRYLIEIYGEKSMLCSWNVHNPVTKKVPLEIDHINGNAEDNHESNLRLICPNCHSLSPNFRNLNKGKGRAWRIIHNLRSIN